MAAAAPKLGSRGGGDTGFARRAFEDGELSLDPRRPRSLYWNKNKTSPYNGETRRLRAGSAASASASASFPKAAQPPVPTVDKRG